MSAVEASSTNATGPLRTRWTIGVTWLLTAVLAAATLYGLFSDRAYRLDRTVHLESMTQDVLTLAIVPVLVWAGRRSRAGSLRAHLLWLGLLGYLANVLFLVAERRLLAWHRGWRAAEPV